MMFQLSIFDRQASRRERDKAISQADKSASNEWKELALAAVETVAINKQFFTSDDVVRILEQMEKLHGIYTHEKRALGGIMNRSKNDKIIRPTDGFRPSERKQSHSNPKRIWESLLYNPLI